MMDGSHPRLMEQVDPTVVRHQHSWVTNSNLTPFKRVWTRSTSAGEVSSPLAKPPSDLSNYCRIPHQPMHSTNTLRNLTRSTNYILTHTSEDAHMSPLDQILHVGRQGTLPMNEAMAESMERSIMKETSLVSMKTLTKNNSQRMSTTERD